jgi:hypothetical protein
MINAIYAVAASLVIATAVALAPSFVSSVEAAGADIAISQNNRTEVLKCSAQAWPNIDASCLRGADNKSVTRPVRVISMNRG